MVYMMEPNAWRVSRRPAFTQPAFYPKCKNLRLTIFRRSINRSASLTGWACFKELFPSSLEISCARIEFVITDSLYDDSLRSLLAARLGTRIYAAHVYGYRNYYCFPECYTIINPWPHSLEEGFDLFVARRKPPLAHGSPFIKRKRAQCQY
jgi:hypothetical protein